MILQKRHGLFSILSLFVLLSLSDCFVFAQNNSADSVPDTFVKGADVSWLPEMEKSGFKFYDKTKVEKDCLEILKDYGMNTVRLRTWVNPSKDSVNGHCSSAETVAMAVRAKHCGLRVMIDFHYSDRWADPAHQVKPTAWTNLNCSDLRSAVYQYTYQVMQDLKSAGVEPEWVQLGNEINPGMLLPDGSSQTMSNLALLINEGYAAVKAVCSNTSVILHLASGSNNGLFRWFFDGMTQNDAHYDMIGMSYYPYWDHKSYTETIDLLMSNMTDMVCRYHKKVMIVETGGLDAKPDETYAMLSAVIQKVRSIPNGDGIGVLYWEPEGAKVWSGYGLSAWESNGKPTRALDAFLP